MPALTRAHHCSNWYIAPFLAQIGLLGTEELQRVQRVQHEANVGKQQHRMLPNQSWAPREEKNM